MNTIKPVAWKMQIAHDQDFSAAADAMRDQLRKHVGPDDKMNVEDVQDGEGRYAVAVIVIGARANAPTLRAWEPARAEPV